MGLDLVDYENKARESVKAFWGNRKAAKQKQIESGKTDQGERGTATAGNNMNGFLALLIDLVHANGLEDAVIHQKRSLLALPGYFRPTKLWDLLVFYNGQLIAAIELKSQVGSFSNNYNNRTEEAIGTAHDLQFAYDRDLLGKQPRPFVGWLMHVEDAPKSNSPIKETSPHFPILPEFKDASYLKRYHLLCEKLMKEQLYNAACLMTSNHDSINTGDYRCLEDTSDLKNFVTKFAGHIAAEAARLK